MLTLNTDLQTCSEYILLKSPITYLIFNGGTLCNI